MTPAELRELLAKATPGPWSVGSLSFRCVKSHHSRLHPGPGGDDGCVYDHSELLTGESFDRCVSSTTDELIGYNDYGPVLDNAADARLIVALRNSAPALLDRVEALERALGEAADALFRARNMLGAINQSEPSRDRQAAFIDAANGESAARALLRDGEGTR